jgi:hypothetical protein
MQQTAKAAKSHVPPPGGEKVRTARRCARACSSAAGALPVGGERGMLSRL